MKTLFIVVSVLLIAFFLGTGASTMDARRLATVNQTATDSPQQSMESPRSDPTSTPTVETDEPPLSSSDLACHWQGLTLRHNATKYFVGRANRPGSVFGECLNGVFTCYEDSGLADLETNQHQQIPHERCSTTPTRPTQQTQME